MNREKQSSGTLEQWQSLANRQRCHIVAAARHEIAANCNELVELCRSAQRTDPVETLSSELIPLCAALQFIGRRGPKILRSQHIGLMGRPIWLWGVRSKIERVPRGQVLILAAWNYPLLLPGIQAAQGLAAGNRVFLKPAPGCEAVTELLVNMFRRAGVPDSVLQLLPSATESAIELIDKGVDLVVLTGSSSTGRAVLRQCAEKLTPAILELSGCDAVIVGKDANIERTAKAIRFGLMFNGGATCIGPRRILVADSIKSQLQAQLKHEFTNSPMVVVHEAAFAAVRELVADTMRRGAGNILALAPNPAPIDRASFAPIIFDDVQPDWPIANSDFFAPIASLITFDADQEAIDIVNQCCYRLAASVFGAEAWANSVASQLNVGTITINDLIFPTADPRLPFGGRGESGFGVTRGAQGLIDMTMPRVVANHRGALFLHLAPKKPGDFDTLANSLTLTHGRFSEKWTALRRFCRGVKFNADSPPMPLLPTTHPTDKNQ